MCERTQTQVLVLPTGEKKDCSVTAPLAAFNLLLEAFFFVPEVPDEEVWVTRRGLFASEAIGVEKIELTSAKLSTESDEWGRFKASAVEAAEETLGEGDNLEGEGETLREEVNVPSFG